MRSVGAELRVYGFQPCILVVGHGRGLVATSYDIVLQQGLTFSLVVTWENPDGTPIDLTGYSAKLLVVNNLTSKTSVLTFDSGGSGSSGTSLVLGGTAGTLTIGMTAVATAALTAKQSTYTLLAEDPSSNVYGLMSGRFTVESGVSW